jgi:hypothetical protein
MDDLFMPTLPCYEHSAGCDLVGSVVPRASLTAADRVRMFELLSTYFEGTSREVFDADLAEKDFAIVLRDQESGTVQGFSTCLQFSVPVDGKNVVAFFSGDTIVDRRFWGESLLSRIWGQTIFAEADRITAERCVAEIFWFLICSGYKTFRFLPVFFREFYPNPYSETPREMQSILDALGLAKFGHRYDATAGIIRFETPTPLRPGIADINEQRIADPMVAFFVKKNPGHFRGDELACIAAISRSNLTRAGERMLRCRIDPK